MPRKSGRLDGGVRYVLGMVPFVWYDHRIPRLEEIADTKWGRKMSVLSICGMDLGLMNRGWDARRGFD